MDQGIKYLEMLQGIISRMADNSFKLKGWAVTLVSAMFVLSDKDSNQFFFLVAYLPIIFFWILDSYYLQLERKFRELYNLALPVSSGCVDFSVETKQSSRQEKTCYYQSFLSVTELGFYLPLAVVAAIVGYVL